MSALSQGKSILVVFSFKQLSYSYFLQAILEAASRCSETEREKLALAWKRYEEACTEVNAERETTNAESEATGKELSAKEAL